MKVRNLMTRGVIAVHPWEPLKEAVRLMERHGVSGLPVVDDEGAVVGVLSEADLLLKEVGSGELTRRRFGWLLGETRPARVARQKAAAVTVAEAMTSPAVVASADEPVRSAARRMVDRRVNRLPVVDGGQLVGILTRADIARTFLRSDEEIKAAIHAEIDRCTLGTPIGGLSVRVSEGVVHVAGQVDRRSTADVLTTIVRQLDGVVAADVSFTWVFDDTTPDPIEQEYINLPWTKLR